MERTETCLETISKRLWVGYFDHLATIQNSLATSTVACSTSSITWALQLATFTNCRADFFTGNMHFWNWGFVSKQSLDWEVSSAYRKTLSGQNAVCGWFIIYWLSWLSNGTYSDWCAQRLICAALCMARLTEHGLLSLLGLNSDFMMKLLFKV